MRNLFLLPLLAAALSSFIALTALTLAPAAPAAAAVAAPACTTADQVVPAEQARVAADADAHVKSLTVAEHTRLEGKAAMTFVLALVQMGAPVPPEFAQATEIVVTEAKDPAGKLQPYYGVFGVANGCANGASIFVSVPIADEVLNAVQKSA